MVYWKNVPCALEKAVYSAIVRCSALHMYQVSLLIVLISLSLLIFVPSYCIHY